ncbi:MAG: hypothetical protein AB7R90_05120 [Reyranellaceae bacterium]
MPLAPAATPSLLSGFALAAGLSAGLAASAAAQSAAPPRPLIDPAARCGVFAPAAIARPYPHLKWSGACRDGLADGKGVASFAATAQSPPNKRWEGHFRHGFFVGDAALRGAIVPLGDRAALIELAHNAPQDGTVWLHARLPHDGAPLERCGSGTAELAVEAPADLVASDEARLRGMMQRAILAYRQACPAPLPLLLAVVEQGKRAALGVGSFAGATDVVARASLRQGAPADAIHDFRNVATGESDQGRRGQAIEDRRRQERADSRRNWQDFSRAHGVALWVTPRQLDANPFRYQGRIVAFPSRFVRMLAPGTALLRDDRWGAVMVSGLPDDLLQDKSVAVIAGRAGARKSLPHARQEIASVEAVAWQLCRRAGCADYLDWIDAERKFAWGEDQSEFMK